MKHDYRKPHKCLDCGKERMIMYHHGEPENTRCLNCARKRPQKPRVYQHGNKWHSWKGGRQKDSNGYIRIYLDTTHPYYPMVDIKGYILEHRLKVAESLGRCLARNEHVHHKNGIKDDNRVENLELISPANHNLLQHICATCELRKEIRLLQWQIKEQSDQIKLLTSERMGL